MGAGLYRVGEVRGSELGGLFRSMPWTAGFCVVGAASISAFPLFSGFVSKSMIMVEAAGQGHYLLWFLLLFAAAGVVEHAGIKVPYFAFFSHDSGLRPKEAPINMLIAMGISSFLCIFLGCNPAWLYDLLPNRALMPDGVQYYPYDATHVINQTQILLFAMLAVTFLMLRKTYPPEKRSINLDIDWVYRKVGNKFLHSMDLFWNTLNKKVHTLIVVDFISKVGSFTKAGQVHVMTIVAEKLHNLGLTSSASTGQEKSKMDKRAKLGLHPIGLTAVFALLFVGAFLLIAAS
jgi:multicomponent Na+:H+ antiporter subunit D